jgi:predicted cupin superfamily sugar epimerase
MTDHSSDYWKKHLQLIHHIEGGWYSEVYKSAVTIAASHLPSQFKGDRSACTHIYFMLEKGEFSAFHRIQSDELWHFYSGDPLIIYELENDGTLIKHYLGKDLEKGQSLFCVVKSGNWFASEVMENSKYALVGCTVSPGFDFADFELANRNMLTEKFPDHKALIERLCRQ